ncbi:dNA-binding domain-containing protein AraC-type [Alistipes sp. CAG:268]|uniref:AraC family transcriptional regulator n=1 Tax=Alistipes sp. CAG:268 TaxID=1262693 RepID=UPI0003364CA4|nr:helix-turn-helix domain-containing protein [Alistipes sp. CAG:268]CDC97130.1 dNA-binding domain-containing protein AraC-type [Alistipes sp. CAG:268]
MTEYNPIMTTPEEQFVVGDTDLRYFEEHSCRTEGGAILFCRRGSATVTVDQLHDRITRDTLLLLLPGSILHLNERTDDFRVRFCAFSIELFSEAAYRLDPSFFHILHDHAVIRLPDRIVEAVRNWFQMASYTYRDRDNIFRNTIIRNRLQNVLLEAFDKTRRFAPDVHPQSGTTRQADLFQHFVALVHEHCTEQREVAFYADQLCISTRYLSTIVRSVAHSTAKEFIDRSVVLEIKMLLESTELSVQEIAYRLHFPDQSYLGRFFKKHTGVSPTEFRNAKK